MKKPFVSTGILFVMAATLVLVPALDVFSGTDGVPATTPAVPAINTGNTAWVLISTALIMMMIAPALAFFYGGLVKRKNVLSVLMQCFITLAVVSLQWVTVGYSLSFSTGHELIPGFLGGLDWSFLNGVGVSPSGTYGTTIPHLAFMMFQGMFACIAPALIIGAFAERIKFSSFLVFTVLWSFLVYDPIAHWVWSTRGWLSEKGALDFAGGTVIHISAGMAALAATLVIGRRRHMKVTPPHSLPFTVLGAAMLWFGWFGFNAGSALAADGIAANALVVTNTAAAMGALAWALLDWFTGKKPTILGAATGAVAGLVAITPAAGYVDVTGALAIGMAATLACFPMVMYVKHKLGYDDTLDAFGVHGIGGIVGAILTGILATPSIQASGTGLLAGNPDALTTQLVAIGTTMAYSFTVSFILFKAIDKTMGLRVSEKEEAMGLDVTQHNEHGYTIIE